MAFTDYLLATYQNCRFRIENENYESLTWEEGNPLPKPSLEEYEQNKNYITPAFTPEQIAAQEAAVAALQYRSLRAAEYPSFAEQFDLLYHGGYDAWKAQIQAVKNKYPKS
jgi:hypothetical protein